MVTGLFVMVGLFVVFGLFVATGLFVVIGLFVVAGLLEVPGLFEVPGLIVIAGLLELAGLFEVFGLFVAAGLLEVLGLFVVAGLFELPGLLVMVGLFEVPGLFRRFLTVILQTHFLFAVLPAILAVPAFLARTSPFLFTEATFLFEDFHEIFPGRPLIFSLHVFPTNIVAFFRFILADAAFASDVCARVAASEKVMTPAVRVRVIFLFIVIFLSSFECK